MAKILVAEDERDIRELIEFTLRFAGHQVTAVANGEEALIMAQDILPDLLLMDVRMPKMTGYEACRQLKEEDATKNIPVIFLTAKGQDEEIKIGFDVGAVEYMVKPFSPEALNRRVSEILHKIGAE